MAQFASYSFDVSILEILHPNATPRRLAGGAEDFRVSHLLLTPTVARTIAPGISHLLYRS
jgi:non-ribosomal peptide synthetase component F